MSKFHPSPVWSRFAVVGALAGAASACGGAARPVVRDEVATSSDRCVLGAYAVDSVQPRYAEVSIMNGKIIVVRTCISMRSRA